MNEPAVLPCSGARAQACKRWKPSRPLQRSRSMPPHRTVGRRAKKSSSSALQGGLGNGVEAPCVGDQLRRTTEHRCTSPSNGRCGWMLKSAPGPMRWIGVTSLPWGSLALSPVRCGRRRESTPCATGSTGWNGPRRAASRKRNGFGSDETRYRSGMSRTAESIGCTAVGGIGHTLYRVQNPRLHRQHATARPGRKRRSNAVRIRAQGRPASGSCRRRP